MQDQVLDKPKKKHSFTGYFKNEFKKLKKHKAIAAFILPAVIISFVLGYIPMLGVIFAFKEQVRASYWLYDTLTSGWTLQNFINVFADEAFLIALGNTLTISILKLIIIFPLTIIVAIMLAEIKKPWISKIILIVLCLPNFLSWPVCIGIWQNILGLDTGVLNNIIAKMGGERIYFFNDWYMFLVIFLAAWKGLGWGSIYYYAAIVSIDKSYYEAATIDGANKIQKIRYLTLPSILPIIALMLVMNITYILDAGFDQIYSMLQLVRSSTYDKQILGTYIFDLAMQNSNIPFTVALSVFNGLFALFLMLGGNALVKKTLHRSLW